MTLVSVSCLAGFGSHNYSPSGNIPSHQPYTKLSAAANTNTNTSKNTNTLQTHKSTHVEIQIQINPQLQSSREHSLPSA